MLELLERLLPLDSEGLSTWLLPLSAEESQVPRTLPHVPLEEADGLPTWLLPLSALAHLPLETEEADGLPTWLLPLSALEHLCLEPEDDADGLPTWLLPLKDAGFPTESSPLGSGESSPAFPAPRILGLRLPGAGCTRAVL